MNEIVKARNFVPAMPSRQSAPVAMPINSQVAHVIDAAPVATQHVEMRTSAVDRAQGFLLASVPLYAMFAAAVVAVVVLGWNVPLASMATLTIFVLSFTAAWIIGYTYTLSISPEGVSLLEAKEKWGIIRREQDYRWRYYAMQIERNDDGTN